VFVVVRTWALDAAVSLTNTSSFRPGLLVTWKRRGRVSMNMPSAPTAVGLHALGKRLPMALTVSVPERSLASVATTACSNALNCSCSAPQPRTPVRGERCSMQLPDKAGLVS
jgi:hypothetical protein